MWLHCRKWGRGIKDYIMKAKSDEKEDNWKTTHQTKNAKEILLGEI